MFRPPKALNLSCSVFSSQPFRRLCVPLYHCYVTWTITQIKSIESLLMAYSPLKENNQQIQYITFYVMFTHAKTALVMLQPYSINNKGNFVALLSPFQVLKIFKEVIAFVRLVDGILHPFIFFFVAFSFGDSRLRFNCSLLLLLAHLVLHNNFYIALFIG